MPSVLIAKEDGIVLLDFELQPGRTYCIGRLKSSDICLDAKSVSRSHAILYNHDDRWLMSDLGSTKGIRTEAGIVRDHEMIHEDWVAIGPAVIWFFDANAERAASAPGPGVEDQTEGASTNSDETSQITGDSKLILDIVHADTGERTGVMLGTRSILIGSDSKCNVTIDGPGIAPVHAILFHNGGRWSVTSVNEIPLSGPDGAQTGCAPLSVDGGARVGPLEMSMFRAVSPTIHKRLQAPDAVEDDLLSGGDPLDLDLSALAEQSPGKPDRPSR